MINRFNLELFVGIIVMCLLFTGAIIFMAEAIDKVKRAECLTWQEQSTEMTGWYATDWQKVQCARYDINLY